MALNQTSVGSRLTILYRGFLSSCNYACTYCPFAKHTESRAEHARDAAALERFVTWVEARAAPTRVMFTPYGEALVRPRYQRAVTRLSKLEGVDKVVVQTNGSWRLDWLAGVNLSKLGLWITFHPSEVRLERFVRRCTQLLESGVRFSVGVVGMRENLEIIERLRASLPQSVYVWVNAFDRRPAHYYTPETLERLCAVDPLFAFNLRRYRSRGLECRAGESVVSVDADGVARRCHFIHTPLGNLYDADFESKLLPRVCTRGFCDCHIGYVHLHELEPGGVDLYDVFGDGVLERIPMNVQASISGA
jgi:MoaA/NifB/PqqE/SkfB family radical SAM enzyme